MFQIRAGVKNILTPMEILREKYSMRTCLVIKNDGIGDLICASGVIAELAKVFSGGVDLVTCQQNKEIAECIPGVRKKIYVSRDAVSTRHRSLQKHREHPFWKKISLPYSTERGDYKVFFHLLTTKYDTAISLRRYIRFSTAELMALTRAKHKYACWQYPTNFKLKTMRRMSRQWTILRPTDEALWEASYYRLFLEKATGREFPGAPRLDLPSYSLPEVPENSLGLIITDRLARTWPEAYWDRTLKELLTWGRPLYLFGDHSDRAELRKKYAREPLIHDYCGKLGLLEHVPYFKRMAAVLAEDTGITHLAVYGGVKTLVLQCGRDNGFFFPWTSPEALNSTVFHTHSCSGCFWKPHHSACSPARRAKITCIKSVTPEAALNWFKKLLDGPVQPPAQIELNSRLTV